MYDFLQAIWQFLQDALPFAAITFVLCAALLIVLHGKLRQDGTRLSRRRTATLLLLLCYLSGLLALALFNRAEQAAHVIQLRPFLAFREAWNRFTLKTWLNPILNVLMLLPLGLLLPPCAKRFLRWGWMLAASLGLSLAIELLQYLLGCGIADVDDLICNTWGAMLGYCLYLQLRSLLKKRWKKAAVSAALPLLTVGTAVAVLFCYQMQPYGNLADAPIYAADTAGVKWILTCPLPDAQESAGVYWAKPFSQADCDAFASAFLPLQWISCRLDDADRTYYDDYASYTDHSSFCLNVNYRDGSYEFLDYRSYWEPRGTGSEEALRAALQSRGITLPAQASFFDADATRGAYAWNVNCVTADGKLVYGSLRCELAQSGAICAIRNDLAVCGPAGAADILSPREAYARLRAGKFSWRDVPAFSDDPPSRVLVTACTLDYLPDSKGFRQPVYTFTYHRDDETDACVTFVPALTDEGRSDK